MRCRETNDFQSSSWHVSQWGFIYWERRSEVQQRGCGWAVVWGFFFSFCGCQARYVFATAQRRWNAQMHRRGEWVVFSRLLGTCEACAFTAVSESSCGWWKTIDCCSCAAKRFALMDIRCVFLKAQVYMHSGDTGWVHDCDVVLGPTIDYRCE
jgi:hypothetical protein